MGTEVRHYPCPGCGAEMHFSPKDGGLHCDYCERNEEVPCQSTGPKLPLSAYRDTAVTAAPTPIHCPKCGAGYEIPQGAFATLCPYCDTPALIDPKAPYRPESLLPFQISQKEAQKIFADWIGSLWLAPRALKHLVDTQSEMKGYWLPWWLFDADTVSLYKGERGDAYYVTVPRRRIVNGREQVVQEQERRIRWTPVSGRVARDFRDLPVPAAENLPPDLLEKLPFPESAKRCTADERYCCGFNAYEYSRTPLASYKEAKETMQNRIRQDVRRAIGGDEQRIYAIQTHYSGESCEYTLRPIWSNAFRYKGKEYRFVIDGTSGEIAGDWPVSYWKIALIGLAIVLMILAFNWPKVAAWLQQLQG
ncbi:hypothetical protein [Hydrogenimonas sp. SS33]|uniref:hypothetical protein n=1 Tax=Hydrogenimonas leucolamina TaxID=2954236 RepID=UPI00336C0D93